MARRGDSQSVAVTVVAKFKTALQMVDYTPALDGKHRLERSAATSGGHWIGHCGIADALVDVDLHRVLMDSSAVAERLTLSLLGLQSKSCGNSSAGRAQPCQG